MVIRRYWWQAVNPPSPTILQQKFCSIFFPKTSYFPFAGLLLAPHANIIFRLFLVVNYLFSSYISTLSACLLVRYHPHAKHQNAKMKKKIIRQHEKYISFDHSIKVPNAKNCKQTHTHTHTERTFWYVHTNLYINRPF